MKVLQVTTGAQLGGAGIAAYRLHKGLRSLGVDSRMLVNKLREHEDYIVGPSSTFDKISARITPYLDRLPARLSKPPPGRCSSAWVPDRLVHRISHLEPDILNLHWVNNGFMRIETLPRFQQPVVWTFHDMWPFAGGEHYVGTSTRYMEGYSAKNRPSMESGVDINRWIWGRKAKSWSNLQDLVIAAPSKWMAKCAGESALFRDFRIEVLPNGVDHERFQPLDHALARRILGLPQDKKLILFGAVSATSDVRKGFHLLVDTLKDIEVQNNASDYELVIFGSSSGHKSFSLKTHSLGTFHDEISMALVYAAADVFVAPSVEDNLPNTVLEAMSCGTPVVSFNVGGIPDLIDHKNNGYLATGFDTAELADGIMWILSEQQRWDRLSNEARRTVVQSFTLEHCASRYRHIYESILGVV